MRRKKLERRAALEFLSHNVTPGNRSGATNSRSSLVAHVLIGKPASTFPGHASAGAHDGDEVVAMPGTAGARAAGRDRAGNVVAIDLAVGHSLPVFVGAAIGIRDSLAARRAGREAAVDAVAIAVIGDDENPLFRMSGACAKQEGRAE